MRAESLNGFPLLDLIRSLHTALLFIGSEKLPRSYHVLGWRAVALKSQISTIFRTSSALARARFISFFADHFRQQTTVMQSNLNRRVRLDCVYRTDHVSFACEANSVAAFENS